MAPTFARRWRRYHLGFYDGLHVVIEGHQDAFVLTTLGGGGCGMIGFDPLVDLVPPMTRTLRFRPNDGLHLKARLPFIINAQLIYVTPHNMMTGQKYFGFQFVESDRATIDPILRDFTELAARGAIEEVR